MKIALPLLLLCISFHVSALDCKVPMTTIDINQCAKIEQQKIEKELNVVYQRVFKHIKNISKNPENTLQKDLKQDFTAAQRLWIKLREADCINLYNVYSGGTIRNAMYIGCMQSRAEQRIKELKQFAPYVEE